MSNNEVTVTNPELKANLDFLRVKQSTELQEKIYDQIANEARFLAVVTSAENTSPETAKYEFPVLTSTGGGHIFYPLFTDMDELRKWNSEDSAQTLTLSFDECAELLSQNSKSEGFVINPFSGNFTMDRELVDYLKIQKAFFGKLAIEQMFQQSQDSGIRTEDPAEYPTEMMEAIRTYMESDPTIRRAWLRVMINGDERSFLIVIDGDSDDYIDVSGIAYPFLKDMYLDLMPLQDEFSKNAVSGVEPFYCKA